MSPATTPHVRLQCEVAAGATRIESVTLAPGRYRVRSVEAGGERDLDYTGGELPAIYVSRDDVQLLETSPAGSATLVNRDARTRTIVIPYFPYGCGLYPFRSSVSLIESVT